jgi:hypothetical protein
MNPSSYLRSRAILACTLIASEPATSRAAPAAGEGAVIPCLARTGDFQPIAPNTSVPAAGREMLAVFRVPPEDHIRKLVATWMVDNVGAAAPHDYHIAQADFDVTTSTNGVFRYSQPKPHPTGTYRLAVTADGKPWKSANITVVDAPALKVGAPAGLVPLVEGSTWT